MSELTTLIQQNNELILALRKEVHDLTVLVMKSKVDDTWVSEDVAAEMLGFADAKHMRRRVKTSVLPIDYRSSNGRRFQYNRKSILKFKESTSIQQ